MSIEFQRNIKIYQLLCETEICIKKERKINEDIVKV